MAYDPVFEENKKRLAEINAGGAPPASVFRYTPTATPAAPAVAGANSDMARAQALGINTNVSGWLDTLRSRSTNPGPTAGPADPIASYYEGLNRTAPTAQDEDTIREQVRRQMQDRIDAINLQFNRLSEEERLRGEGRSGQTRAINARSGLMGSDFGEANKRGTENVNKQAVEAIENERNLALTSVYAQIDDRTREEFAAKKQLALDNAGEYINYLERAQEGVRSNIITGAQNGAQFTPEQKAALMRQGQLSEIEFDSLFNANKPAPEKVKYTYDVRRDGSIVRYGDDGEVKIFEDTKLPDEVDPQFINTDDGTILYVDKNNPTNPDGTPRFQVLGNFAKPLAGSSSGGVGLGSAGASNDLINAILENPSLFNQLTPSARTQLLPELSRLGFQPTTSTQIGKSQEAIAAFNSAEAQLGLIEKLAKDVITAKTPLQAFGQSLTRPISARVKSDKQTAVFKDTVNAFLSMLTRATGERGVLTTQDVERIKNALPGFSDTADIAQAKLDTLHGLFESIKQGTISAYTQSVSGGSSAGTNVIRVRQKSSGQTGTIPESEFDPNVYERI